MFKSLFLQSAALKLLQLPLTSTNQRKHLIFQPLPPQGHASKDHQLPYIVEADDAERGDDMRHSQQRRVPLLPAGSPVRQPCLGTLLGEELRHINALSICRSPVQGGRGPSPSSQPFAHQELSSSPLSSLTSDPGLNHRPANLLMPSLPCISPLNLSPR